MKLPSTRDLFFQFLSTTDQWSGGRMPWHRQVVQRQQLLSEPFRRVFVNEPSLNALFPLNRISNTKYTPLTFMPKNLAEQFSRFMNQYFLLVACLQLSPTLTPVSPVTTWVPLGVIFAISAIKEAMDDYRRSVADSEANRRLFKVLRSGHLIQIPSQYIRVGDIIRVEDNGEFPCDMVLLQSSEPFGFCYVQTANLDGETDLKPRLALAETASLTDTQLGSVRAEIHCPQPNNHIYEFDAALHLNYPPPSSSLNANTFSAGSTVKLVSADSGAILPRARSQGTLAAPAEDNRPLSLSPKQFLLQGTFLRNCDYIYGVAVYTGRDTKLALNKLKSKTKWTKVDKRIDLASRFVFSLQLVIVLIFGLSGNAIMNSQFAHVWYLDSKSEEERWYTGFIIPIRMLLLLSFMIPISLKVSLDIVKYIAALFIGWDVNMYDEDTDEPAHASSTAIAEDLGQIEYIMTDKTGTLTENLMALKQCTIVNELFANPDVTLTKDSKLKQFTQENPQAHHFFRCIALCNSVVPCYPEHSTLVYRGSSPDEECLVKAAAELGITLQERSNDLIGIEVHQRKETYQVMQVLEFTSDRKRMSVVVREQQSGDVYLFTKGADDVIFDACSKDPVHNEMLQRTAKYLEDFGSIGLRTLCLAMRQISTQEFEAWNAAFQKANASLENRENLIKQCFANLERDLILLGATAIEDRLQKGVPETIKLLRSAGIKIWMLTGDKKATARQIAGTCNMITDGQDGNELLDLEFVHDDKLGRPPSFVEIKQTIDQMHLHVLDRLSHRAPSTPGSGSRSSHDQLGVIIDGHSLRRVFDDAACTKSFSNLCMLVDVIVGCRVTPLQKSKMVELMKNRGKITLAIGDGGNDVSMIQKANIGVGIKGREGQQAARASDYCIGKFRYLGRLLLFHGRYAYKRTSFVALYCFYKSFFIAAGQAMYQYDSGFSGTSLLNTFSLSTYNILFTSLPILFYILDRDIPEEMVFRFPTVYQECVKGLAFNRGRFLGWIFRALIQSIIVYYFVFGAMHDSRSTFDGFIQGETNMSLTLYTAAIIIQTLTLIFQSHSLTLVNWTVILGTAVFYFIVLATISHIPRFGMFGASEELNGDIAYALTVILSGVSAMFPVLALQYHRSNYKASMSDLIRRAAVGDIPLSQLGDFEMQSPTDYSNRRTNEVEGGSY